MRYSTEQGIFHDVCRGLQPAAVPAIEAIVFIHHICNQILHQFGDIHMDAITRYVCEIGEEEKEETKEDITAAGTFSWGGEECFNAVVTYSCVSR